MMESHTASAYLAANYDFDPHNLKIGICPCGYDALVRKAELPEILSIHCSPAEQEHSYTSTKLDPALARLNKDNNRRTAKATFLQILNDWIQVHQDAGSDQPLLDPQIASLTDEPSLDVNDRSVGINDAVGGPQDVGGAQRASEPITGSTATANLATEDSLPISLIDVHESVRDPAVLRRVIISNVFNLLKHPFRLAKFSVNTFWLVRALLQGDIIGVFQQLRPFIQVFAPRWLAHMNDNLYRDMGASLGEMRWRQQLAGIQQTIEARTGGQVAAYSQLSADHATELEAALNDERCG